MDMQQIIERIDEQYRTLPGNELPNEIFLCTSALFDKPIVGFGSADDELFEQYKKIGIIGPWHLSPKEWLLEAKTIVSMFFPINENVRRHNAAQNDMASKEWAFTRVECQAFIGRFMQELRDWLVESGTAACVPAIDPRFTYIRGGKVIAAQPAPIPGEDGDVGDEDLDSSIYSSAWSERHAAYVCGLGTFCLSKGLITEKGVAGRYASVIIDTEIERSARPYTGIYDYCTKCGACAARCPAGAIDLLNGKDHVKCAAYLHKCTPLLKPYYGCGLCQTGVPCEAGIPWKEI